jgi:hypothetical protein
MVGPMLHQAQRVGGKPVGRAAKQQVQGREFHGLALAHAGQQGLARGGVWREQARAKSIGRKRSGGGRWALCGQYAGIFAMKQA